MSGGFQRDRGQRVAQIRLMEPDGAQTRRSRVMTEPPLRHLIRARPTEPGCSRRCASRRRHQGERRRKRAPHVPPGMPAPRRAVVTGDHVQTRTAALTVRHGIECPGWTVGLGSRFAVRASRRRAPSGRASSAAASAWPERVRPTGRDDQCAGQEQSTTVPASTRRHDRVPHQSQPLRRWRHVGPHVPSPAGPGKWLEIGEGEDGRRTRQRQGDAHHGRRLGSGPPQQEVRGHRGECVRPDLG